MSDVYQGAQSSAERKQIKQGNKTINRLLVCNIVFASFLYMMECLRDACGNVSISCFEGGLGTILLAV